MSSDEHESIPIHSFELNSTTLPTNKFQLIDEHDQTQNNILQMDYRSSHSSYTKEFDMKTYIVDSVEYKMCSFHSFDFSKRLPTLYA